MIQQFLILLLFSTSLFADMNRPKSIDAEINKIRTASPRQRVVLMNAFKQRMMQMNQQERLQAIKVMRTRMQTNTSHMQMQNSVQISHAQNIYQHQVDKKFSSEINHKNNKDLFSHTLPTR